MLCCGLGFTDTQWPEEPQLGVSRHVTYCHNRMGEVFRQDPARTRVWWVISALKSRPHPQTSKLLRLLFWVRKQLEIWIYGRDRRVFCWKTRTLVLSPAWKLCKHQPLPVILLRTFTHLKSTSSGVHCVTDMQPRLRSSGREFPVLDPGFLLDCGVGASGG